MKQPEGNASKQKEYKDVATGWLPQLLHELKYQDI